MSHDADQTGLVWDAVSSSACVRRKGLGPKDQAGKTSYEVCKQ